MNSSIPDKLRSSEGIYQIIRREALMLTAVSQIFSCSVVNTIATQPPLSTEKSSQPIIEKPPIVLKDVTPTWTNTVPVTTVNNQEKTINTSIDNLNITLPPIFTIKLNEIVPVTADWQRIIDMYSVLPERAPSLSVQKKVLNQQIGSSAYNEKPVQRDMQNCTLETILVSADDFDKNIRLFENEVQQKQLRPEELVEMANMTGKQVSKIYEKIVNTPLDKPSDSSTYDELTDIMLRPVYEDLKKFYPKIPVCSMLMYRNQDKQQSFIVSALSKFFEHNNLNFNVNYIRQCVGGQFGIMPIFTLEEPLCAESLSTDGTLLNMQEISCPSKKSKSISDALISTASYLLQKKKEYSDLTDLQSVPQNLTLIKRFIYFTTHPSLQGFQREDNVVLNYIPGLQDQKEVDSTLLHETKHQLFSHSIANKAVEAKRKFLQFESEPLVHVEGTTNAKYSWSEITEADSFVFEYLHAVESGNNEIALNVLKTVLKTDVKTYKLIHDLVDSYITYLSIKHNNQFNQQLFLKPEVAKEFVTIVSKRLRDFAWYYINADWKKNEETEYSCK